MLGLPEDPRLGVGVLTEGAEGLVGTDLLKPGEGLERIVAGGLLGLGEELGGRGAALGVEDPRSPAIRSDRELLPELIRLPTDPDDA